VPDNLVEIRGLTKAFGGLDAVSDLDIDIAAGQTIGLIGPNGAGKTTVLSLVSGFIRPDSGTVTLDGTEVTGWPTHRLVRRGLARTFQAASLYPELTVRQNMIASLQVIDDSGVFSRIRLGPLLGRKSDLEDESERVLESVGMLAVADVEAVSLPYGSQRMLGLAMSMSLKPRILLLDEPAAGMNAREREELVALLRRLKNDGATIVLIEHDVPLVAAVCDRVVVINYGKKISEGTPDEIRSDQAVIDAYLGGGDE
jgi:ABC-type branched-subunit amino acid transport system ATPase component